MWPCKMHVGYSDIYIYVHINDTTHDDKIMRTLKLIGLSTK